MKLFKSFIIPLISLFALFPCSLSADDCIESGWPKDSCWVDIKSGGGLLQDPIDANGGRDVVSSSTKAAAKMYNDGINIYFRLRMKESPVSGSGLEQFGWGVEISTDGDDTDYELLLILDGKRDKLKLGVNSVQGEINDPSDDPESFITEDDLEHGTNFRVVEADSSVGVDTPDINYYLDWRYNYTTLKVNSNVRDGSPAFTDNTGIKLFFGSSADTGNLREQGASGDLVGDQSLGDPGKWELTDGWSDVITPTGSLPPNNAPVAIADSATTTEDVAITISVVANDTDVDNDPLTISATTNPGNGSVTVTNSSTHITYTPTANFNGSDSFTYTVSDGIATSTTTVNITINPVNDAPAAVDDFETTNEDTPVIVDVLFNDTDIDGGTLTVESIGVVTGGSATKTAGSTSISVTPDANSTDSVTFIYTVTDGNGGSAVANVTVTVNPVNDAPAALDDAGVTNEDTPVIVDVLSNDTDIDGGTLTVESIGVVTGGSATKTAGSTSISVTPDANSTASVTFTYTVTDGNGGSAVANVTVTVNPVNDAPDAFDDAGVTNEDTPVIVDVLFNDTDIDGGTLTVESIGVVTGGSATKTAGSTSISVTPDANSTDSVTFTYTVTDGNGGSATANVTVTVNAVNDDPVAVNDNSVVDENSSVIVDVLSNDTDIDGGALTVTSIDNVIGGSATATAGATSILVTPDPNSTTTVTFTYTVSDGNGGTATATVTVSVNGAGNDAPVAVHDTDSVDEDGSVIVDVIGNDTDPENDVLTVVSITNIVGGSVTTTLGSTSVLVVPTPDSNASVTFTYTVTDGNGGSATANVTVTVNAVNDAPIAVNDNSIVDENSSVIVDVLSNDTDIDGGALTVTSIDNVIGGSATATAGATSILVTPDPNSTTTVTFSYTVSDGNGGTSTATVTVTVNGAGNGSPVAVLDNANVDEDSSVIVDVLSNDTDPENDVLTVISITNIVGGSVIATTGATSISVTPAPNSTASVTFNYTVTDGNGGTATANVIVTVNPINDAPVAQDDVETLDGVPSILITVLNNDSDLDNDALIISSVSTPSNGSAITSGTQIIYTPNPNFSGEDSFNYEINDGNGGTATAKVTITVAPFYGVSLVSSSAPQQGNPGDKLTYLASVGNTGNATDLFQLKPVSSNNWNVLLYHDVDGDGLLSAADILLTDTDNDGNVDTGNLGSGLELKVLVITTIPVGSEDASKDNLVLTACSSKDTTKSANISKETQVNAPVITALKTVSPTGSLPPGTVLTYNVIISNSGSGKATNLRVSDQLDALLEFQSDSLMTGVVGSLLSRTDLLDSDNAYFNSNTRSVFAGGKGVTLAAGESFGLQFKATMQSGLAGSILKNIANVNYADSNGNSYAGISAGVDVSIEGAPLLFVQKLPSSDPVASGAEMTYTIEYENRGNTDATGVRIRDVLSSDVILLENDPLLLNSGGVYNATDHEVNFQIGTLPSSQKGQVSFKVKVKNGITDGTKIFNHANLESDQSPTLETSFVTVGLAPSLQITIERDNGIVTDKDEIQYNVDFRNIGNLDSTNTFVTVPVPVGTALITDSVSGLNASIGRVARAASQVASSKSRISRSVATVNGTNTEITWNVGLLAKQGGAGQEGFRVQVPTGTPEGTLIPASAAIESTEVPRIVARTVSSVVVANVELKLDQVANKTTARFGDQVTFSVDVTNAGDVDLTGVVVRIPIPAGTVFDSGPAGSGVINNELVVSVGNILKGAISEFDFTVVVSGSLLNLSAIESNATAISNETQAVLSRAAVNLVNEPAVITFVEPDGTPVNIFRENDPICIQVDDISQNTNPATSQQITVTLANLNVADSETVTLIETGVNNGSFRGCINSSNVPGVTGDGIFNVARDQNLSVVYNDPDFPAVSLQALAVVDPVNRVINSLDGSAVANLRLTIIDTATGAALNLAGNPTTSNNAGEFNFPSLPVGNYRIDITGTDSFVYPSQVENANLPAGLTIANGSRGQTFNITGTGGFVNFDIPVDPRAGNLRITKTGDKNRAFIGDLLKFRVEIANEGATPMNDVVVRDLMPHGMQYIAGSSRLDGVAVVDPTLSGPRHLTYNLGVLNGAQSRVLEYRVVLSAGSREGRVANMARASANHLGTAVASLVSRYVIDISEGVFTDRGTLIGKVFIDINGDGLQSCITTESEESAACVVEPGISGAVLYLEDGTRVVTDKHGKYLVPAVERGQHVVVLDRTSVPAGLQPVAINNAGKGNQWSQFVNNDFGGLFKANFALKGSAAVSIINADLLDSESDPIELKNINVDSTILVDAIEVKLSNEAMVADGKSIQELELRVLPEGSKQIDSDLWATVELTSGQLLQKDLNPEMSGVQILVKNGVAKVRLKAPSEAGEGSVRVLVNGTQKTESIRFKPNLRESLVAGVGEIRFGRGQTEGSRELLNESGLLKDGSYVKGRGAFFVKEKLGSKTLLTAAYDSAKQTRDDLFRTRESNQDRESLYPIHGDESNLSYEAVSQRKAYVKLERDDSSLMFGDFRAPLNKTNLSAYSRSLNGFRVDLRKNSWNLDGFHSLTSRTLVREELRGRGITGFYFFNQARMLEGSERILVETRRRDRPDMVIDRQLKVRGKDYEIDYVLSGVRFKAPIPSVDVYLNPVFIIALYESENFDDKLDLFGGRVAKKIGSQFEIGVSRIEEHQLVGDYQLSGVDAVLNIKDGLELRYEFAESDSIVDQNNMISIVPGQARELRLEGQLRSDLKVDAYYREADAQFSNPSAYQVFPGTRKKGIGAIYELNDRSSLSGSFFLDRNTIDNHYYRHSSLGLQHKINQTRLGVELIREQSEDFVTQAGSSTFRGGFDIAAETPERFMGYRATLKRPLSDRLDLNVSAKADIRDQDYFLGHVGLDYQLNTEQKLYLRQERARFDETRDRRMVFGAETSLTDNMSAFSEYRLGKDSDGTRTQRLLGIENRFSFGKGLKGDVRFETLDTTTGAELTHQPDGNSVSVGMEYLGLEKIKTSLRLEKRTSVGTETRNIDLGAGYSVSDHLKALVKHRWIDNQFNDLRSQRSTRSIFGLAYRPVHHDRFNALAKVELRDGYSAAAKPSDGSSADIYSVDFHYQWQPTLQIAGRYASKLSREDGFSSHLSLSSMRLIKDLNDRWDLSYNFRVLRGHDQPARLDGHRFELGYRMKKNLWLLLGYSVDEFDADLTGDFYEGKGAYFGFKAKF